MDNKKGLKQEVRRLSLSRRNAIPAVEREAMDLLILGRLLGLEEYNAAGRVLLYASYQSEAGTLRIIENAMDSGKEVVLPKVDEPNCCLTKHVISSVDDIRAGFKGIPEPTTDVCVRVEEVDIVIAPGLAFSPKGARIGYGGGYYDRLLPRVKGKTPIVALAYEQQIFDNIPEEEYDIGMDIIITPQRTIYCHG